MGTIQCNAKQETSSLSKTWQKRASIRERHLPELGKRPYSLATTTRIAAVTDRHPGFLSPRDLRRAGGWEEGGGNIPPTPNRRLGLADPG